ncbi:hypothetical protein P170DRAFT_433352 [Aspergillus steynii IBT 23096]|uniref:BZIP domain-containing protein n=1 Tax=Aspergillus steynii IBT 23096 TaxID=1392250 RepID=A0A2I2GSN0_9EURO|nr:uncharacterized protein P170DRAFT_433352 [Aspergillus steynii IBT 23096]PLB55878.1 hypothetical protein P170DRAFT_433352 [Aspergillus steynii IBT 23096]
MSADLSLPPSQSADLSSPLFLPYLTDDAWLNLNHLRGQPGNWNLTPAPQPSQNRKRRNSPPIRHPDPPDVHKDRDDAERQKRQKSLARNRRAATKCREKKREFTKRLKHQYEEASQRKQSLESHLAQLQQETLELKNELLRHSQCADPAIQHHLAAMVKDVTTTKPPDLTRSYPLSEDTGSGALGTSGDESGRMRRDSVLSLSTDVSLDSFINDDFLDLVNLGSGNLS